MRKTDTPSTAAIMLPFVEAADMVKTNLGDSAAAKHQEGWLVDMHGRKMASECVKCGECEQVCPQHISIRDELEKAAIALA